MNGGRDASETRPTQLPLLLLALSRPFRQLAEHVDQWHPASTVRSFLIMAVVGLVAMAAVRAAGRERRKVALLAWVILAVLLYPQPLYYSLRLLLDLGLPQIAISAAVVIGLVGSTAAFLVGILRSAPDARWIFWGLELRMLVSLFLVLPAGLRMFGYHLAERPGPLASPRIQTAAPREDRPDVYLFILDAYSRHDVLQGDLGFDNRPFLQALGSRGFYVAERSRANYGITLMSITSTLGLDYWEIPEELASSGSRDQWPMLAHFQRPALIEAFREAGYHTTAISSGSILTELVEADEQRPALLGVPESGVLVNSLLGLPLKRWHSSLHRRSLRAALTAPATLPDLEAPRFVLVHVLAPHFPYVFDGEGREVLLPGPFAVGMRPQLPILEWYPHYLEQLRWLNARLLETVDALAAPGRRPTVVVMHGDHGYATGDPGSRMPILNAIRFPDRDHGALYPEISPVNTLRMIAGRWLGADLPPLPERAWHSETKDPYRLVEVSDVSYRAPAQPLIPPAPTAP